MPDLTGGPAVATGAAPAVGAPPGTAPAGRWIGQPVRRAEDRYLLTGRGRFVGDLEPSGTLHLALVRSYAASAAIEAIDASAALSLPGVAAVITAADLAGVAPLRGVLDRPEFIATDMPILAADRVRHVGEPIAAVLAESAYLAEDAVELVEVTYGELPAVASAGEALAPGAAAVHEAAPGNVLVDFTPMPTPGLDGIFASAAHVVEAEVSSGRVTAAPMEGRVCLAAFDERTGQVVLQTSTQVPHTVRTAVALSLGMDEHQVRVISPDVGGGFGQKCVVAREEVLAAAVARRLRRTVQWVEDRRERLTAGFQAREQCYRLRGAFDADGRIIGLDADIHCDVGAYSCYPVTCGVELLMAANELPGPYRVQSYRVRSRGIATNKTPIAPYRGVSRPQAVLVMERLMEEAGRATGLGAVGVRDRNLIDASEFPYRNVMGATYDEGTYRESLAHAPSCSAMATGRPCRRGPRADRPAYRARATPASRAHRVRHARRSACEDDHRARLRRGRPVRMDPSGERDRDDRHLRTRSGARDHVRPDRRGPRLASTRAGSGSARVTPTSCRTAGAPLPAARS